MVWSRSKLVPAPCWDYFTEWYWSVKGLALFNWLVLVTANAGIIVKLVHQTYVWDYFQIILRLFLRAARVCFNGQCCGVSLPEACSVSRDGRCKKGSLQATCAHMHVMHVTSTTWRGMQGRARPRTACSFCFGCR